MTARSLRLTGLTVLVLSLAIVGMVIVTNFDSLVTRMFNSDELLSQAKKKLREPSLPPKPAGQVVQSTETKTIDVSVPCPTWSNPMRTCSQKINQQVPVTRAINPSDEQLSNWEKAVAELRNNYQKELKEEVDRLQTERLKTFRESLQAWVQIVAGIIGSLGGIVTIIVAFRKGRREA